MSISLQIIGVAVGLTLICKVAATPMTNFINRLKVKITPVPKTIINTTIKITSDPIVVTTEPYPVIRKFLNNLPDCEWCVACGSYTRYVYLEAEKQGVPIGEITITDSDRNRAKQLTMDGHRINYFYADDGHKVYIDNMHNWKCILELNQIKKHIKNKFGFDLDKISFKNQKDIPT